MRLTIEALKEGKVRNRLHVAADGVEDKWRAQRRRRRPDVTDAFLTVARQDFSGPACQPDSMPPSHQTPRDIEAEGGPASNSGVPSNV